ncbi:MAG: hypothetical protein M1825_005307 [Sarcosagium campestre]|nr:MAG: hypothetical protein M1825_005307 [Sarcosagium campestre]
MAKVPTRCIIVMRMADPFYAKAWDHIDEMLDSALVALWESGLFGEDEEMYAEARASQRLLFKQRFARRVHVTFDLFHYDYNSDLGHLHERNQLPVYRINHPGRGVSIRLADPWLALKTNWETAYVHNINGPDGHSPYSSDHLSSAPFTMNPRDLPLIIRTPYDDSMRILP